MEHFDTIEFDTGVDTVSIKDGKVTIKLTADPDKINFSELARMQKVGVTARLISKQSSLDVDNEDSNETED